MLKLDTTSTTHVLFLDLLEVENLHNTDLVVNQAKKYPSNPVLPLGDVGEWDLRRASSWGGSVIFDEDEQIFKLWYYGVPREEDFTAIGYALSEDGIYWDKPNLDIHEYRGSKQNNIVFRSPTGQKIFRVIRPNLSDHFTVTKDYTELDPAKRYKGWARLYYEQEDKNTYFPVYSSDGILWDVGSAPVAYPTVDATNLIVDDADPDPGRRIKLYGQLHSADSSLGHRDMGYGPDIEHCVPSPHNPVIERAGGLEHTVHLFAASSYKGYYIMLYNYNLWLDYYGQKGNVERRRRDTRVPEPKTGAFVGDIRLAVNRDGVSKFARVNSHQPVVARGEKGEWDSGFLVGSAPIVRGDMIYIFYSAADESAGACPNTLQEDVPSPIRMGLATLRLDGYANLQSRDGLAPAVVTTALISVTNPTEATLLLNASQLIPYRDWIEVEILDAGTNSPLEGYRREDCTDLIREGIRLPVHWGDQRTLAGVGVSNILLRFYLYGRAKLYSFTFS